MRNTSVHFLRILRASGLALLMTASAGVAWADYPERTVRVVVGLQAGAGTDALARQMARQMGDKLGQAFIVENKPGAATRIGMEMVARAPADGYTIGVANAVAATFPLMFDNFAFEPGKDFTAITMLGRVPSYLAVRDDLPVKNVQEFVAYAKAHSGKLSFGHGGNGTNPHLSALVLVRSLGVKAIEVPYKGNAPTAVALGGGEIDFAMLDYPSVRPLVERGNVRLLAVTEPKRVGMTPQVPTSGEQGLTRELDGMAPWFMLVAPAGTPAPVINLLSQQAGAALGSPEVNKTLASAGIEVETGTPAQAQRYFMEQRERMTRLARELKVSLKN